MAETLEVRDGRATAPETAAGGRGLGAPVHSRDRHGVASGEGASPVVSIAAGCSFEGLLTFHGATQVDGRLVGEVVATGTLRLGATARVRARIEVDELIVEGELEGDIVARRRIELSPSARVTGSLEAPRLSLAEGCVFQGRCRCIT
jgi:cytoskeletal protein CcmA (bactofilin family)